MDIRPFLENSRQLIIVSASKASGIEAELTYFEKRDEERWVAKGNFPVVIGKNGIADGVGLLPLPSHANLKKEGDHKALQGLFKLGTAFGYAEKVDFNYPYISITEDLICVDDPKSSLYDCIVSKTQFAEKDWNSAEDMLRPDGLYKWGLVIEHNIEKHFTGVGSCIFMHIWRNEKSGTEGCTAMDESNLVKLLHWLNPDFNPLLLQGHCEWLNALTWR